MTKAVATGRLEITLDNGTLLHRQMVRRRKMSAQPKLKNRYEIKEVLSKGGMSVVYPASDTVVRRDVALKTLRDKPAPATLETFQMGLSHLAYVTRSFGGY